MLLKAEIIAYRLMRIERLSNNRNVCDLAGSLTKPGFCCPMSRAKKTIEKTVLLII